MISAWFFFLVLFTESGNMTSSTIGPFSSEEQCKEIRTSLTTRLKLSLSTACWHGPGK
jgi:hypothetical protein